MFVVGFATEAEIEALKATGWDVEDARAFDKVVGDENGTLMRHPIESQSGTHAVAIFVDASLFDVLKNQEYGSYKLEAFDRGERRPCTKEDPGGPIRATAQFECIESPFDEYPGDGLRLAKVGDREAFNAAHSGGGPDTELLTKAGLNELRKGDIVEVNARLVSRIVQQRVKA